MVFPCLVLLLIGIFKSDNKTKTAALVLMMLSLFNAVALSFSRGGSGATGFAYLGIIDLEMSNVGQIVRVSLSIDSGIDVRMGCRQNMEEAIREATLQPTTQVAAGEQLGWGIEIRPIHYFEKIE